VWDETVSPLLDVLPVGVLALSGENGLVRANEPGLRYLGLDAEVIGKDGFLEHIDDENLKKALAAPANGVVRLAFPNGGRSYHAEVRPDPTGSNGGKLLVLKDVTGVSNMAVLRRHFVFDLLHKLRTPLTTILSVLSMATSGRLDPTRVDFTEILGMGAMQAERLTGLLARLKDLFLLETGGLSEEMQIQVVPVSAVVGQEVEHVRGKAGERFQTLIEDYPSEPVFAMADSETLSRAVLMVLANALGFTPDAGEIRVSVISDPDAVRIRIADNGPGIPADEMPIVFERFRRGTSPEVRAVEGEGIGLFLARQLLLLQGGTILLDSRHGHGTTAEITLPRPEEDA